MRTAGVMLLCFVLIGPTQTRGFGQNSSEVTSDPGKVDQAKKPQKAKPRRKNPAMEPVQDVAGLPRVLLIGDSISIGYTVAVREMLRGKANVHRPPVNCSSTRTGASQIESWLGDRPWDVIHFNFGLHDLKYVVGDTAQLVAIGTKDSHRQVPVEEYRQNLERIVEVLKKTDAKLVWCNTTPVPKGAKGRIPGDVDIYNAVAQEVMKAAGVDTNDLNAHATPEIDKIQRKKDVHFTPKGSEYLAKGVAEAIVRQIQP